jgi:hypothetical protein
MPGKWRPRNRAALWKWLCLVIPVSVSGAQAEPTFQLDPSGARVVSISNLYPLAEACDPRRLRGTVVERRFRDDRVTVSSFVLDLPNGSRAAINVETHLRGLTLTASGWIVRGLQTLLVEGQFIDVVAKFCGVSGHIIVLDTVREVAPSEQ